MDTWMTWLFARAQAVALLAAVFFTGCSCGNPPPGGDAGPTLVCGAGTKEVDGACVPDEKPDVDAGPNLECGPGTKPNAAGTGCVPLCDDPFVLEGSQCVCPPGLIPTPDDTDCQIDPALCAEGTAYVEGQGCVPVTAPPPADDDTNPDEEPVRFDLPGADDKPYEVGGVIGPVDRTEGPDVDVFYFDGEAGQRLFIQLVSFGAQAASFLLQGLPDTPTEPVFRAALPLANRRAQRHVVLPVSGTYAILVTDRANLVGGFGGLPTGGEDQTYSLIVDVENPVSPTTIPADGSVLTGAHDDIDAYRVDPNAVDAGSILNAILAENEADPDADTLQVLWYVDSAGNYVEVGPGATAEVNALFPQIGGGLVFYVDYLFRLGINPAYDYSLAVNEVTIHDGPVANGNPLDASTEGEALTFFSVVFRENHVYRIRLRLPENTTIPGTFLALVDEAFNVLAFSSPTFVNGVAYEELRHFAGVGAAGTYYVAVVDGQEQDPILQPNFNVRLTLEEAPVVHSATLALPNSATTTAQLNDPQDNGPDAWSGPWALLVPSTFGDLVIATDQWVDFATFDAAGFSALTGIDLPSASGETRRRYRLRTGTQVLVQAVGGDQTGQFTLSGTLLQSPYSWESEPNDAADAANSLPISAAPQLVERTEPAPAEGACGDLSSAPRITETGRYTVTLTNPAANFDSFDWTCARDGTDVFWVIPQQPAGTTITVETESLGDNANANTYLSVIQAPSCNPAEAACLAENDDIDYFGNNYLSRLSYTFTGEEGDVILLVDSWQGFGPLTPGTLVVDIAFVPGPFGGFTQEGDADWWALEVSEAGMLTVTTTAGPIVRYSAIQLTLYGTDGETVLAGPIEGNFDAATAQAYVLEAGTYYAVVEYAGYPGDYTIAWTLNPQAEPPITCTEPVVVEALGEFVGDTSAAGGSINNWVPPDSSCLGYPPAFYNAPDHIYSYTLPAGRTLRARVSASFDAALAILDGSCEGACLMGSDRFGDDEVVYRNDTGSDQLLFIVVDGWGGETGTYTLTLEVFGTACLAGEQRCSEENGEEFVEICNDNGTGFERIPCPGGCTYDSFEQVATCNPYCGPGSQRPKLLCEDRVLRVCSPDGTRYEQMTCAVACSEVTDPNTQEVVDAFCTFGLCPGGLGAPSCDVVTIDSTDVAVAAICNETGSWAERQSCGAGCNNEGTACAPYTWPSLVDEPEDACPADPSSGDVITASGVQIVDLWTLDDNFDEITNACGAPAALGAGVDLVYVLGPKPAGTEVRVRVQGEGFDPVVGFQAACDSQCTNRVAAAGPGAPAESTYTYSGDEMVLLVVDSNTMWADAAEVEIEFSDDPFTRGAPICTPNAVTCEQSTNLLSACDETGTLETQTYCIAGCNADGTACETVKLGESCNDPGTFPALVASGGVFEFEVDLSSLAHDYDGSCRQFGNGQDAIIQLKPTISGRLRVNASGSDTVLYAYEGACGSAGAEVACNDDDDESPPFGYGSTVELPVAAETDYFIALDLYDSFTPTTGITLTVELWETE